MPMKVCLHLASVNIIIHLEINYLVFSLFKQDLEKLETIKKQALLNPIEFVDKLTKGEDVGIPPELNIEEVRTKFVFKIILHC
jgi:hypothetical protein